ETVLRLIEHAGFGGDHPAALFETALPYGRCLLDHDCSCKSLDVNRSAPMRPPTQLPVGGGLFPARSRFAVRRALRMMRCVASISWRVSSGARAYARGSRATRPRRCAPRRGR